MYTFVKGDAISVLKGFNDELFDITLTSPPFKEEDVDRDYWAFYSDFMEQVLRVTQNVVIVIHSPTKINYIIQNWPPKRTMIWGKGVVQYTHRYNPIFVYQKGDHYKVNKYIWSDTFGIQPIKNGTQKSHKYQDPLELYVLLLKMFKGNKTVLDPFIGSGTTAKAASLLGLDCTGIDLVDYLSV